MTDRPWTLLSLMALLAIVGFASLVVASIPSETASAGPPPPAAGAKSVACYDDLCGMDSYCSCHDEPKGKRCWSQAADCEVDRECCDTRVGAACYAQGTDTCSQVTHEERVKRDATAPPPGSSAANEGRFYLRVPQTDGKPKISDCNDGEFMVDTKRRKFWVCDAKHAWWSVP